MNARVMRAAIGDADEPRHCLAALRLRQRCRASGEPPGTKKKAAPKGEAFK